MPDHLDTVAYFARHAAHSRRIATTSETVHAPMQVKRWWINRSPFVYGRSKDLFDQRTFKRIIQVYNVREKRVLDGWVIICFFVFFVMVALL
jgi:ribosomal protein S10